MSTVPSSAFTLRIKKADTAIALNKLVETKRYSTVNAAINAALERGLPLLLSGAHSDSEQQALAELVANKVVDKFLPFEKNIVWNIKKVTLLQMVQESMLSSIIKEFEFFLQAKEGLTIDPALLEEFKSSLPERFETDKEELITKLFDAIDEGEANE